MAVPPEVFYRPAVTDRELLEVLDLQRRNQPAALSAEEMEREGYVTLTHSLPLLRQMQGRGPQIVCVANGRVVGYALCLHPELAGEVPALAPMFRAIRLVRGADSEYRVMGQVCIEKKFRGQGHFRRLYRELQKCCSPLPLITEVAESNKRSLEAHRAIGFESLTRHEDGGTRWEVLILQ